MLEELLQKSTTNTTLRADFDAMKKQYPGGKFFKRNFSKLNEEVQAEETKRLSKGSRNNMSWSVLAVRFRVVLRGHFGEQLDFTSVEVGAEAYGVYGAARLYDGDRLVGNGIRFVGVHGDAAGE